jgi:transmembrane secretion effector
LATDTEKDLVGRNSAGLGRPLRVPIFRKLLIADLVSDIGTFMQNVCAAWVLFISLINALVQNLAPDWVRARVLSIFTLVYMGSFALGSAAWGGVAQRRGTGSL